MRKNIFNTVAGLLVAVSMLFAAIGCTNINDPDTLKNDSFTVNKMAITGFKVTGLEGSYDHATVQLKSGDTVIAEGIIADDDDDLTPGSAFVKLETPYIFDAGENSPKDFECYLEVVKSGVKLADIKAVDPEDLTAVANAKLPIIPSPYGTKDADLAKRYVEVEVNNGVGAFSFAEELSASLRFSYTALPEMNWETFKAAADDPAKEWAKIEKTAKANADYATYKIIVKNLENDEDGMRYVVAGENIGSKKDKICSNWKAWASNNADEGLISVVENGTVEFNFFGKKATGWDNGDNAAIKIAAIDDPMESDPWLCLLTAPNNGNFNLPTDGDYTITIDAKGANAEYKFSAVNERFVKVLSFTLKSKNIQDSNGAGYVAFCANWLPKNVYGAKTTNKVTFDKITDGTATLALGGVELWAGKPDTFIDVEMQVLNPQSDDLFWNDDTTKGKNAKVMSSFKVHFDDKFIGTGVHITYDLDNYEVTIENTSVNVIGYKLINIPAEREGATLYVHGQSSTRKQPQPGNAWDTSTPHKGVVTDGEVTIEFAPENIWTLTEEANVQVIASHWSDKVVGGDMGGFDTKNLDSMPNGSDCVIVVDCEAKTVEFAPKQ